jgi:hypothetical protein
MLNVINMRAASQQLEILQKQVEKQVDTREVSQSYPHRIMSHLVGWIKNH